MNDLLQVVCLLTKLQSEAVKHHLKYIHLALVLTFLNLRDQVLYKFTKQTRLVVSNFFRNLNFLNSAWFQPVNQLHSPNVLLRQITRQVILLVAHLGLVLAWLILHTPKMPVTVGVLWLKFQSINFVKRGMKECVFSSRLKLYLVHLLRFILKLCIPMLCLIDPNVNSLEAFHDIRYRLDYLEMTHQSVQSVHSVNRLFYVGNNLLSFV